MNELKRGLMWGAFGVVWGMSFATLADWTHNVLYAIVAFVGTIFLMAIGPVWREMWKDFKDGWNEPDPQKTVAMKPESEHELPTQKVE